MNWTRVKGPDAIEVYMLDACPIHFSFVVG